MRIDRIIQRLFAICLLVPLMGSPVVVAKTPPLEGPSTTGSAAAVEGPSAASGPARTEPVAEEVDQRAVVMAWVDDDAITVGDFLQFITMTPPLKEKVQTSAGRAEVLRMMISDRLLRKALSDEPELLPANPSDEDYTKAYLDLERRHFAVPRPTITELHDYYLAHREEFGIPEMVHVKQIQLRVPEGATAEQSAAVREKAVTLWERLRQGESFDKLAAEFTENPKYKGARKGNIGFLPLNADPWLKKALDGVQPGQTTGVLESKVGYEILFYVAHRDPIFTPIEQVKAKVLKHWLNEQTKRARERYVAGLAKKYKVNIPLDGLKGANPADQIQLEEAKQ